LNGTTPVPKVSEIKAIKADRTDSVEKQVLLAYRVNSLAVSHLVSSVDTTKDAGKIATSILCNNKNLDYPNGNAFTAVEALNRHYNVRLVATAMKYTDEFNAHKISVYTDPSVTIALMEQARIKVADSDKDLAISDKAFKVRLFQIVSSEYHQTVELLRRDFKQNPTACSIEHISLELQ
jgi:flagellar hook protein FlgE